MLINGLSLRVGRAGGAETFARRLFPPLLDRFDPDAMVLLREDTSVGLAAEGWDRSRHHEVRIGNESPVSVPVASLRARSFVRAHRGPVLSPYNLHTAGADRSREVVTAHDFLPLHYLAGEFGPIPVRSRALLEVKARLLCKAVAAAGAVVVHADAVRADIDRYVPGVDQRKVHVVHLGRGRDPLPEGSGDADVDLVDLPERFVLVLASSLLPHKNIDLVFRMARLPRFAELGASIVLVGRSLPALPPDLAGRVVMKKNLDDRSLDACFRRCAAVLNPSLSEGFGLPVLEALQRGVPIAASDISPYREIGGEIPHFFDPRSPDAALDALIGVVDADDRAGRAAATAQAAPFTWYACADGYAEVLRAVSP